MRASKTVSIILIFLMFSSVFVMPKTAQAAQESDGTYTIDTGTGMIVGYEGPGGIVTIPATITTASGTYNVSGIGKAQSGSYGGITNLSFASPGITIGKQAFKGCSGLTSIDLSNVTSIGVEAFYQCTSLSSVTIPDGFTEISNRAFVCCTSLSNLVIPDSVTEIGEGAFAGCTSLSSVTIPDSVTYIGGDAFSEGGLVSVTIPDSVESIEWYTFRSCVNLSSVNIPDNVTYIGFAAFADCPSLNSVTIPDSVTYIGFDAFADCPSLNSVNIPDNVTEIDFRTFAGCTSLSSVTIPNGVTAIGDGAFFGCTSLNSVVIPNSVTMIGPNAFAGCTSLTGITIPGGVTEIGDDTFSGCTGLQDAVFLGDAPTVCTRNGLDWSYPLEIINGDVAIFADADPDFIIKYYQGAAGFTTPTWRGYNTIELTNSYSITVSSMSGGNINVDKSSAAPGETINLTITPNAGMQLKAGSVKYNDGTADTIITGTSFSMPSANITITAEFEVNTSIIGNVSNSSYFALPLTLVNTDPSSGEQSMDVGKNITLQYNQNIYARSSASKVTITDISGQLVQCNWRVSGCNLIIDPVKDLLPDTQYTFTVPDSLVMSAAGNTNSADTISFTTEAADLEPIVTISSPNSGKVVKKGNPVSIKASATDDQGIKSMAVYIDGVQKRTFSANSLSYSLSTSSMSTGSHTIKVTAYDGTQYGEASARFTLKQETIPVTSVSLDQNSLSLVKGQTAALNETVLPSNASDKSVKWSSNKTAVATVDSSGTVKAISPGTAIITCISEDDSNKFAQCTVTVKEGSSLVSSVKLNKHNLSLAAGQNDLLQATVTLVTDINGGMPFLGGVITTASYILDPVVMSENNAQFTEASAGAVPIVSIKLNKSSLSLKTGETSSLQATISPSNATNQSVKWSSDKKAVATVDSNGKVTAVGPGTAIISCVSAENSSKYGQCTVTVTGGSIAVVSIKLNKSSLSLKTGETSSLQATISPSNATNQSVKWSSDKKAVATVDSSGKVTAVGPGTAVISCVSTENSSKYGQCTVTVTGSSIPVISITLDKSTLSLTTGSTGNTYNLQATVNPSNAADMGVTWDSDRQAVATVDANGKVTAVGPGTAVISCVSSVDRTKYAKCTVTVTAATNDFSDDPNRRVIWSSDNPAVAKVDANGKVTAVGSGTAVISAVSAIDSSKYDECTVVVSGLNSALPSVSDIVVNNGKPIVKGQNSNLVPISFNCNTASGIQSISLYVVKDGKEYLKETILPPTREFKPWDISWTTAGTYDVLIRVTDTKGNTGQDSVPVIVEAEPVLDVTKITVNEGNDLVKGVTQCPVKVYFTYKSSSKLESIQFYVNGQLKDALPNTDAPNQPANTGYGNFDWDFSETATGTAQLKIVVTDVNHKQDELTQNITIANPKKVKPTITVSNPLEGKVYPLGDISFEAQGSTYIKAMNIYDISSGTRVSLPGKQIEGNRLSYTHNFKNSGTYSLLVTGIDIFEQTVEVPISIVVGNPQPIITKVTPLEGDTSKTLDIVIEGTGFTGSSANVNKLVLLPVSTDGTTYSTEDSGDTKITNLVVTNTIITATLPKGVKTGEYRVKVVKVIPKTDGLSCVSKDKIKLAPVNVIDEVGMHPGSRLIYNEVWDISQVEYMKDIFMAGDCLVVDIAILQENVPDRIRVSLLDAKGKAEDYFDFDDPNASGSSLYSDGKLHLECEFRNMEAGDSSSDYSKTVEICPYVNGQKVVPVQLKIRVCPEMFFWKTAPQVTYDKIYGSNQLTWEKYPGVDSYILTRYKMDSSGKQIEAKDMSVKSNSYIDYDIKDNTSYAYTITAVVGQYTGWPSEQGKVTTGKAGMYSSQKRFINCVAQIANVEFPNGVPIDSTREMYELNASCGEAIEGYKETLEALGLLLKAELIFQSAASNVNILIADETVTEAVFYEGLKQTYLDVFSEITDTIVEKMINRKYSKAVDGASLAFIDAAYKLAYSYEDKCAFLAKNKIDTYPEALEFWYYYQGMCCYKKPAIQLQYDILEIKAHTNPLYNVVEGMYLVITGGLPSGPKLTSTTMAYDALKKGLFSKYGYIHYQSTIAENEKYWAETMVKAKNIPRQ